MMKPKKIDTKQCEFLGCDETLTNKPGRGRSLKYCRQHGKIVQDVQVKHGVAMKRSGLDKDKAISSEDLLQIGHNQNWQCAVTGIRFEFEKPKDHHANPWALSIDRIDPKLDYVKGNVRLVVWLYNLVKSDWDDPTTKQHIKQLYDGVWGTPDVPQP